MQMLFNYTHHLWRDNKYGVSFMASSIYIYIHLYWKLRATYGPAVSCVYCVLIEFNQPTNAKNHSFAKIYQASNLEC